MKILEYCRYHTWSLLGYLLVCVSILNFTDASEKTNEDLPVLGVDFGIFKDFFGEFTFVEDRLLRTGKRYVWGDPSLDFFSVSSGPDNKVDSISIMTVIPKAESDIDQYWEKLSRDASKQALIFSSGKISDFEKLEKGQIGGFSKKKFELILYNQSVKEVMTLKFINDEEKSLAGYLVGLSKY